MSRDKSIRLAARAAEGSEVLSGAASEGELGIHELNEAIVASVVGMQRELARYPQRNGSFLVDELEVELPVTLRIDPLGQVMTRPVSDVMPGSALARLRVKVRPTDQPPAHDLRHADQDLKVLGTLGDADLSRLAKYRIFTAEDLLRACRNAGGRRAVEGLLTGSTLRKAMDRCALLLMPGVPRDLGAGLLSLGMTSVKDFRGRNADKLAAELTEIAGRRITSKEVIAWQAPGSAPASDATDSNNRTGT